MTIHTGIRAFLGILGFVSTAMGICPALAVETSTPDLSGLWAREYIGFEDPASGPGPVRRSRALGGADYTNPILKPEAVEILRQRGEASRAGQLMAQPSNQCAPHPMPYILYQQAIQILQEDDRVTILYMQDAFVRRVRLNTAHPRVPPSWLGDSVGHYEGDTLVIDTIGVKVGALSMVDGVGTPHSDEVHVVERYRLIDYEDALAAFKSNEKNTLYFAANDALGDGVGIDPAYRGKGLHLEFIVEDPKFFTAPWSAANTWLRPSGDWMERICAENTREFGVERKMPTASTPDF